MKTKLPLLLLFFVLFLFKCDLKADPGHKSPLEYRWVNHPLDFLSECDRRQYHYSPFIVI